MSGLDFPIKATIKTGHMNLRPTKCEIETKTYGKWWRTTEYWIKSEHGIRFGPFDTPQDAEMILAQMRWNGL